MMHSETCSSPFKWTSAIIRAFTERLQTYKNRPNRKLYESAFITENVEFIYVFAYSLFYISIHLVCEI